MLLKTFSSGMQDPFLLQTSGETISKEELIQMAPESIILRWINLRLSSCKRKAPLVQDLSVSLQDGVVFIMLLSVIAPDKITIHALDDSDDVERTQDVVGVLDDLDLNEGPIILNTDILGVSTPHFVLSYTSGLTLAHASEQIRLELCASESTDGAQPGSASAHVYD